MSNIEYGVETGKYKLELNGVIVGRFDNCFDADNTLEQEGNKNENCYSSG